VLFHFHEANLLRTKELQNLWETVKQELKKQREAEEEEETSDSSCDDEVSAKKETDSKSTGTEVLVSKMKGMSL
jgi:hypothetical protein